MNDYEGVLPNYYLSWLEVDIAAIRDNYRLLRSLVQPGVAVFGVVKADAYGHGAIRAAKALSEVGAEMLCVARVEEAMELRAAAIRDPLLVFGPPMLSQAEVGLGADASLVVCSAEHIHAVVAAARNANCRAKVHLKLDIGMGRLGVQPRDAAEMARQISSYPELELEGVMSHFPSADMRPREVTLQQIQVFSEAIGAIRAAGMKPRYVHTANSAATMDFPEAHFNAVRCGISLYGQYPSADVRRRIPLRAAMNMKSRVIFVKDVSRGKGLSYGHTFVSPRDMKVATVPLGYADGYPRHASNKTIMIVRGHRAPLVGRVCMDLILLDVTDIADVQIGDEVMAFGRDGDVFLPADAIAAAAGTIGYEMTTRVGKRLPRVYL